MGESLIIYLGFPTFLFSVIRLLRRARSIHPPVSGAKILYRTLLGAEVYCTPGEKPADSLKKLSLVQRQERFIIIAIYLCSFALFLLSK
jgi:hypothetical protein